MPECPYLDRRGYDDYHCRATGSTIPYEYWNRYCSEYNYLECVDYKRMNMNRFINKIYSVLDIKEGSFVFDLVNRFADYVEVKIRKTSSHYNYQGIGDNLTLYFQNDSESLALAHNIFKNVFLQMTSDICINNIDAAFSKFMNMIDSLIDRYKLDVLVSNLQVHNSKTTLVKKIG